ncbi:MAG: DUF4019 domain-containing protein [Opitutales bacterium]
MISKNGFVCWLLWAVALLPLTASAQVPAELRALEEALGWLTLVDTGQYGESHTQMSPLFRNSVKRSDWIASMKGLRRGTGELQNREVQDSFITQELPDHPPGTYCLVKFQSDWGGIDYLLAEIVILELTPEGWRTLGYYVNPANSSPEAGAAGAPKAPSAP